MSSFAITTVVSTETIPEQISFINIENDRLSYHGFIDIQGTITDRTDVTENLILTVNTVDGSSYWESESILITIDPNGNWQYALDVRSYLDGEYVLFATISGSDSNSLPFTVDNTSPTITIDKPVYQFVKEAIIEGTIDEEIKSGEFILYDNDNVVVETRLLSNTVDAQSNFIFKIDLILPEGTYTFTLNVTDLAGNISETVTGNFTYDISRPYISPASLYPQPNMAQVQIAASEDGDEEYVLIISAQITDNYEMFEEDFPEDAILVYERGTTTPLDGTIKFVEGFLTFEATDPNIWEYNQKYFVFVNPLITDQAGNLIYSRNWSFTTETNTEVESPHGNYLSNTNTCKTCHNTHTATNPKLEGENLEVLDDPEEELRGKHLTMTDTVNGYCMACHDGTVASPMRDHMNQNSDHNKTLVSKEGNVVSQSCGNCHNVHLASHDTNPNLLKDRFTFDHEGVEGALDIGFVDSSVQLCETCHDTDSLTKMLDNRVTYEAFPYRNWNSILDLGESFGRSEDYQLCLRCHNGAFSQDFENVVDIESYYIDTNSGHFIREVDGNSHLPDGSFLDGHIPCADCHTTHSSPNVKLLNEYFGHNNQLEQFKQTNPLGKFVQTELLEGGEWPAERARAFCLTCHNNTTELYGITVSLNEIINGTTIDGHLEGDTRSCASCHGGVNNSFREAAHSPMRLGKED